MLKSFWQGFCELIYPNHCILCKKYSHAESGSLGLCSTCQQTLEFNKPPFCRRCSRYLEQAHANHLCPQCRKMTYHFDRVWATLIYNDIMHKLLHLFKYGNKTSLRKLFSDVVCNFISDYHFPVAQYDFIIPIPLHAARFRERGYNQSQLIVEDISRTYGIAPSFNNLIRTRHTKNQALLKKNERWTNIQDAFRIRNPEACVNKSLLLFDDLLTTGATASEAARILKQAGAKRVDVLTLAIATLDQTD